MAYADVLSRVLASHETRDERTSRKFKAIPGVFFSVGYGGGVPLISLRDINVLWTCAETVWFASGCADPKFMERFKFKNWQKFPESMQYGRRWRDDGDGGDPLERLLDRLANDDTAKSCMIQGCFPWETSISGSPCIASMSFHILGHILQVSVLQRSCDLYFGLPHDMGSVALLRLMIAQELGITPGHISWLAANAHLYENQYENAEVMAGTLAAGQCAVPAIQLPKVSLSRAMQGDEKLVFDLFRPLQAQYQRLNPPKLRLPRIVS
jgi:thymidylate synthase